MAAPGVYLFQGNCLVIPESAKDEQAADFVRKFLPDGVDREKAGEAFGDLEYVTIPGLDGRPITGFLFKDNTPLPAHWRSLPVRQGLQILPEGMVQILRLYHVLQWFKDSIYCGSCGEKNGDSPDELARRCPRCGRIEYPRITPAVIVLVTDDSGRALLAHNTKFKDKMYSLIAGFVEAGEDLETAAYREIKEELNIDIKDLRYVSSQGWPFPSSLMIGFTARYAGGELMPDGIEIADARWFTRGSIQEVIADPEGNSAGVEMPGPGSVSRFLINRWLSAAE